MPDTLTEHLRTTADVPVPDDTESVFDELWRGGRRRRRRRRLAVGAAASIIGLGGVVGISQTVDTLPGIEVAEDGPASGEAAGGQDGQEVNTSSDPADHGIDPLGTGPVLEANEPDDRGVGVLDDGVWRELAGDDGRFPWEGFAEARAACVRDQGFQARGNDAERSVFYERVPEALDDALRRAIRTCEQATPTDESATG